MKPLDVMQIRVDVQQGQTPVTVLHLNGRLNMGTAESLQQKAEAAIAAGTRNILLDLTDLASLTSAGLSVIQLLVKSLDAASRQGKAGSASPSASEKSAHLKLLNPKPDIQRVLNIAGFDLFLEIHHDLQTAIASF